MGEELEKFSSLLCEKFPKVDAWRGWRDVLLDMTEDFAMKNPDGQLAYLKSAKEDNALYEAFVSPEMKREQQEYFEGVDSTTIKREVLYTKKNMIFLGK